MKIYFINCIIFVLACSCARENSKPNNVASKKPIDSIIILKNENDKIDCIYSFSNGKSKKLNEKITFLPNGEIDYANSLFLEVIENDLVFRSPYETSFPIPKKRFVTYIGRKITNDSFNNQTSKLDTTFFNKDSKIENYLKILSPRGKVIEILFLDTIIKVKGVENKTTIRTIEYDVDLNNLLIDVVKDLK